jgi:hypothetical protein
MRELLTKINKLLLSKYPQIHIESLKKEHIDDDSLFFWNTPIKVKNTKPVLIYEVRTNNEFLPSIKNTEDVSDWFFVMTKMIFEDDVNIRVMFNDPHIKRTHSNYLL